jgi:hypothetical protein
VAASERSSGCSEVQKKIHALVGLQQGLPGFAGERRPNPPYQIAMTPGNVRCCRWYCCSCCSGWVRSESRAQDRCARFSLCLRVSMVRI